MKPAQRFHNLCISRGGISQSLHTCRLCTRVLGKVGVYDASMPAVSSTAERVFTQERKLIIIADYYSSQVKLSIDRLVDTFIHEQNNY